MDQQHLRAIYLYEHKLGTSSRETANKINTAFGPNTTTDRIVRNWFQRFNEGDTSLKDIPHTGQSLLHDNARPHKAKITCKFLEELGWTTIPHPPYSPDLAPSDYHLFRALKQHLRKNKFENSGDLKHYLANFFASQPLSFWAKGIEILPSRWLHVLDNAGDYNVD